MSSNLNTHLAIDRTLCGTVTALSDGYAKVVLHTSHRMHADDKGLVHGGFLFGAADYAAMAAVNDPYVVLGAAQTTFVAPVCVGDTVTFEATVTARKGKKAIVDVVGYSRDIKVFEGVFTAFVLDCHVLDRTKQKSL